MKSIRFSQISFEAFFGAVLCLCFNKSGQGLEVELGRDIFHVTWQNRGGVQLKDPKKKLNSEQLEKLLRSWAKSCRRSAAVVRLKLAPSSKLEGLAVPEELLSMDLQRKNDLEKASSDLKTAAKARNLPQLCKALDQALALQLEDDSVDALLRFITFQYYVSLYTFHIISLPYRKYISHLYPLAKDELQEKRLKLKDVEENLSGAKSLEALTEALAEAHELSEWRRDVVETFERKRRPARSASKPILLTYYYFNIHFYITSSITIHIIHISIPLYIFIRSSPDS